MNTLKAFWAIFESIVFNEFFTDCSAVCSYGRTSTSTSRLSARVMSDSSRGRQEIAVMAAFTAEPRPNFFAVFDFRLRVLRQDTTGAPLTPHPSIHLRR